MERRTQVLVVGAGPVGLLAALRLRQRGLDVLVVEQNEHTTARSFAAVLHPHTLALLSGLGSLDPFVWQGRVFKRVVIFAGGERRALLDVPGGSELAQGGLTLPHNVLRSALEQALAAQGVYVEYLHRLASLADDGAEVRAEVMRREPVSTPPSRRGHFEWLEVETISVRASFVIGADGRESSVRKLLGIPWRQTGPARLFGFFDVPHEPPAGQNIELVLDAETSAMYPLHGGTTRYTFELDRAPTEPLDAEKLRKLRAARMPWHPVNRESVEWSSVHTFEPAWSERFGRNRMWLAGDAAHTTNPLGTQSLNVGLREARDLANAVADSAPGRSVEPLASGYAAQREREWRGLLSLGEKPRLQPNAPSWVRHHVAELVAALPASGDDLDESLAQLGITLP
jgi:2-polyprenyl-6-methoxyphenol hydroxylase-like FAD-dependent oxidoreductase